MKTAFPIWAILALAISSVPAMAQTAALREVAGGTPATPAPGSPAPGAMASGSVAPGAMVAEVGTDKMTGADLNRMLEAVKVRDPSLSTGTPTSLAAIKDYQSKIIDNWIDTRLLAQEAARQKLQPRADEVDDMVKGVRSDFTTEDEFNAWLTHDGKSVDDLRRTLADEMAIRMLAKQLTADVTVSGDDIAGYYNANLAKFAIPAALKAHHILLACNPASPAAEKDRVRKRATDLMRQLNTGTDFETLAKANTDDPSSKPVGGNLGLFTRGEMVPAFEEAAFAAPVGKVIGPVETEFGFHIIRVDEILPARTVPLSEVQANAEMRALLLKIKVQKRLDETVAGLKTKTKVKRYL